MDAERRRRISLLYHAARERAEEERHAFLDSACQSDDALRQEVESLLTLDTRMGALRGVPAGEPAAISDADTLQRVPEPGGTLGRYRIERLLGRGGVGTVLLAYDTTLRRRVALKVLSKGADGQTSRTRLLREARSAAALNHPNICMIHEVGEANGSAFIAMEYVEGRSLRDRLDEGALTPDDACRYGVQAADALAYAHDHSVIHRDFKAANVIVTEAGRLKVVDFGLARRGDLMMASGTFLASLVPAGSVAGTPYAMAPEQVRGEPADARTDLWALGILLYEMTVGALPFNARTIPELYSSILRDEPARVADAVPAAIRGVIERCLAKEPDRRYQHAAEVRDALEAIRAGLDGSRASAHSRPAVFSSLAFPGPFVGLTRRRAIALSGAAAIAAASGLATWRLWPRGVAGRSLAVLPFENVLNDESIDYLCEGVTESLIRQTSGLRSLRVTPRSTAFNFKGRTVDARSAGRQLAVDTVLTGTLTRQGGRLLVTAELLEVQSGARLWSNRYERDTTDLLRVQDEIARAIMDDGLRLRLTSDERRQLVRNPTSDGEAYDLYLQARYLQRSATEEGYLQARQLLRRALVRDPDFSLAYVALGATYAMMAVDGLERPTDAWPQANRYTRQALELDPDLTEAHVIAHSQAFFFDWDWAGAERERRILLQSPARDMDPQFLRAVTLERWALGRPDEALQLARKMRELDPLSHNLIMFEADYLVHDGQLDAAVSLYEKAVQTEPGDPNPYFGLADIWSRQGRFDAAIAARRKAHEAASDDELKGVLSAARGEAGYRTIEKAWVRLQLDILTARAAANYLSPLDFARAYAQLDDKAEAFRYLDAAFSDRSPGLVFLKVDRAWDGIRNDPRFEAAVRRVGLP